MAGKALSEEKAQGTDAAQVLTARVIPEVQCPACGHRMAHMRAGSFACIGGGPGCRLDGQAMRIDEQTVTLTPIE